MAGALFLFMTCLLVFALKLAKATEATEKEQADAQKEKVAAVQERDSLITQARGPEVRRKTLLEDLARKLGEAGVTVNIDDKTGVLRLPEGAVKFDTGKDTPNKTGRANLKKVADALEGVLKPYAHELEAILIEGHTDIDPVQNRGRFKDNWELSAARAIATRSSLGSEILQLKNRSGVKLVSVAGYADTRLYNEKDPKDGANRRSEIRFIMAPPGFDRVAGP